MNQPPRRARAIAQPLTGGRMMRDLAADWRRWTPAERIALRLIGLLGAAFCVARVVLTG